MQSNQGHTFGTRLKECRKAKNLTQKELGKAIGISSQVISNWERGYTSGVGPEEVRLLANELNCSVDYLILGQAPLNNIYGNLEESSQQKTNTLKESLTYYDKKDIAKDLENTLNTLETSQDSLMFDGKILDDETRELLKISLENSMRLAKQIAEKYTPKKYKE